MKKGFTLVELSIVLVIIGLLIGGVLVGQSLIASARVNRLVNDLHQYEIATNQFKQKFKKYPGDSTYFIPPGNENNVLGLGGNGNNNCAAAPNTTLSNQEGVQFWTHLSQSKMLKTNYPAFSYAPLCGGIYSDVDLATGKISPYTKVDPIGNLWVWSGNENERLVIYVGKSLSSRNLFFELGLLPADTLALENKLNSQADDATGKQVGATNVNGMNGCKDIDNNSVNCGDSLAIMGMMNYYLAPL